MDRQHKRFYILYRHVRLRATGRPIPYHYLTDDDKEHRSAVYARVFTDREEALTVGSRVSITNDGRVTWCITKIGPGAALSIAKHKLKVRGKRLFSLPVNTPAKIFADLYEENGMTAEADLLRR